MVGDDTVSLTDKLFAGHCRFVMYARARWSDAMVISELSVDGTVGLECYVQAVVQERTKTSNLVNIKRAFLPLTALGIGIANRTWFTEWMAVREFFNLSVSNDSVMMPAPMVGGGFSAEPLSSTHATKWLKEILCAGGEALPEVQGISTHSLKCTLLSWAA
eukprot:6450167-Amphidinium_carterae.1